MPRKKVDPAQIGLLEARTKTAPLVPAVREAVAAWRDGGYKGVTATTRTLLNFWFRADHRLPGGGMFRYHDAQREATETLVYLYEVAGQRRHKDLVERYAPTPDLRLLQYDDFARYCVKMATGSGKTKVMSLAVAWQYFNAVAEGRDDFARTFLVIAPNVIVFERLRTDFAGGRIFTADPVIPPELRVYWDMDCFVRGDGERASSTGALYLTNVQQLYDRPAPKQTEPDAMTAVLGRLPAAAHTGGIAERIAARAVPVMVLNDEAHHTHDEDSEWNKVVRRLHTATLPGLVGQLDFTATPRHNKGALFSWVVSDYSLKQAIIDGLVKRPMKGISARFPHPSDIASVQYQTYLTAGVERWREYRDKLSPFGKKPVLFVMLNSTAEADEVGHDLQMKYPDLFGGDKLLVIHTDRSGDVSKGDLDAARKLARDVDDERSPVNAIVSVLMLREGWDVQNVTVIVGLRPYSSGANILPEQTIGRGLRRMFRERGNEVAETVDVIGTPKFIELVEQLDRDEKLDLGTVDLDKDPVVVVRIEPDPAKMDKDIAVPVLSPVLSRKRTLAEEIAALDVAAMAPHMPLPRKQTDKDAHAFRYEGYDILTLEKMVEREYVVPTMRTAGEVIAFYAKRIAVEVKLPSQFHGLVPKVREFLGTVAFGGPVNLDDATMIRAISSDVAQFVTLDVFKKALRGVLIEQLSPQLLHPGRRLSEVEPFPYSRPTMTATKTIFNLVQCDNDFEREFAAFLEAAPDVAAFAKLPDRFNFTVEYTDSVGNLRYYEPDFVARLTDGTHAIVETKGREDVDVRHKDRAAALWCENATLLTETPWQYQKVPQAAYKQMQPAEFADLAWVAPPPLM